MNKSYITLFILSLASSNAYTHTPQVSNFSGFNVSLGLGFGISNTQIDRQYTNGSPFSDSSDSSNTGVLGGVGLGYGWHLPQNYYCGLQVNYDLANVKGRSQNFASGTTVNQLNFKMNNMGSVYMHIGKIIHNVLPYIKVGGALAKWKTNVNSAMAPEMNTSKTLIAWSIGTGVDFMVTKHLSLGADYAYSRFNNLSWQQDNAANYTLKPRLHTIKLNMRWHF